MAIQFKRKTTAAGAPAGGSLLAGELAFNTFDQKIYTSSNGTDIIELAGNAGVGTVTSVNSLLPDAGGNVLLDTDDISEGITNFYYTSARFDTSFATKTTSNLTEGTNLYWTTARGESMFDSKIAAATTDDLSEGTTNLYYTDARADSRIQAAIQDTVSSSTTLYSSAKVDALVSGSLQYKGAWDASTNTPTLSDATGSQNDFYKVSVGGTQDLGSGSIVFEVGDDVIHNGTKWEAFGSTNLVTSVNSKVGAVVLNTDDIAEGSTNLYYTNARVDAEVATLGYTKIDDATPGSSTTTYSAQKIEAIVGDAEEVDDTATVASTTKVWSINKINANYMPIDVDYGTYV